MYGGLNTMCAAKLHIYCRATAFFFIYFSGRSRQKWRPISQKFGCFFEKTDNFSLILPNFSKKVHDFFAKGVERKQRQNGDLCQHGVRSPKKGD